MRNIPADPQPPWWGILGLVTGAVALILAMLVIFAGPFAPQPGVGTTIGEVAGDIARSLRGQQAPAPEARGWDIDRLLATLTPILGALAIILAIVSSLRHEPWRFAAYGAALGLVGLVVQFIWWIALLICGVLLLVAIIENFGDIMGGMGG